MGAALPQREEYLISIERLFNTQLGHSLVQVY